jgi:hypothetical protein
MTTLSVDTARDFELGARNEFPVIAADIIYEGAAVGIVIASGHARPLTSVDKFGGFAEKQAANSAGAAAAINVRVIKSGSAKLAVTGAVITDVGQPVYAQDDNAFSFLKTSGVFVGFLRRYVSAGYGIVEFNAGVLVDPHEGLTGVTTAGTKTIAVADTGKVVFFTADAAVITMPAIVGLKVRIVNGGAYGTVLGTIAPNASDAIQAVGTTAVADKDLINTKATANRGDFVDLEYGDANGWIVTQSVGTWVKEG